MFGVNVSVSVVVSDTNSAAALQNLSHCPASVKTFTNFLLAAVSNDISRHVKRRVCV